MHGSVRPKWCCWYVSQDETKERIFWKGRQLFIYLGALGAKWTFLPHRDSGSLHRRCPGSVYPRLLWSCEQITLPRELPRERSPFCFRLSPCPFAEGVPFYYFPDIRTGTRNSLTVVNQWTKESVRSSIILLYILYIYIYIIYHI